jgi:hypothetical protein
MLDKFKQEYNLASSTWDDEELNAIQNVMCLGKEIF